MPDLEQNSTNTTPVLEVEQIEVAKYYNLDALDPGLIPAAEQVMAGIPEPCFWLKASLLLRSMFK